MQNVTLNNVAEGKNNIFRNELLLAIANKYNKSVAQVILRWLTERGVVSAEDLEAIKGLDRKTSSFFDHRDSAMVKLLGTYKTVV
jgi:2,5-diketo-D-gluconate reductase A